MIKLVNKSNRSRGIPVSHGRSAIVAAGQSVEITEDDAEAIKKNAVASGWLKNGLIAIEVATGLPDTDDTAESDDARKEELIAELAEYGISKNKRSSVATLEEALAEAKAAAGSEGESEEPGEDDAGEDTETEEGYSDASDN